MPTISQVTNPKSSHTQRGRILIATGIEDKTVTGIAVSLHQVRTRTCVKRLTIVTRHKHEKFEWHAAFEGEWTKGDVYELNRTIWTGKEHQPQPSHSFTIENTANVTDTKQAIPTATKDYFIDVSYPASDITITPEEAEIFIAWGPLGDGHSLASVTFGGRPADYVYDDGSFWIAQLPPTSSGGPYTLEVVDTDPTHVITRAITVS